MSYFDHPTERGTTDLFMRQQIVYLAVKGVMGMPTKNFWLSAAKISSRLFIRKIGKKARLINM